MKSNGSRKARRIRSVGAELYFIPVETRVPLKFGPETVTRVTCARARLSVRDAGGRRAEGWGETPLSVQWVWPGSELSYEARRDAMKDFCRLLGEAWAGFPQAGHPLKVGHRFLQSRLPPLLEEFNEGRAGEPLPRLAGLICCSAFDLALHDAYGKLTGVPTYETYNSAYMERDLAAYLTPAEDVDISFQGKYPADFLHLDPPERIPAWHLVGGEDILDSAGLTGGEPDDGYPVTLAEWIERDGLNCLKVKLRGTDPRWDYERLVRVGEIGLNRGVDWLTSDFNCTVKDPAYVEDILERLMKNRPRIYAMILYVEQPFPYDLENNRIDVHSNSARKPLFMDESAHDWRTVRLGRKLGWTGVALKTCKTQTGALLANCWAKAHGMSLMVQDLTNPMLAQITHLLLGAHVDTLIGVETNSMQFYPEASAPEAKVHPGLYRRREGEVELSTIEGPGFGYRLDEIDRDLPAPDAGWGVVT